MNIHILTPLRRLQNLPQLLANLQPLGVHWHAILDHDTPYYVFFNNAWARSYYCPNHHGAFYERCNYAVNWWLDTHQEFMGDDDLYGILNDDDAYEPGFFDKLRAGTGNVRIVSMKRGDNIPVTEPLRAHGTGTLLAAPAYMAPCAVGIEQLFCTGRILRGCRIPLNPHGDGQMIQWIVGTHGATYLEDAFVLFNYLEPGRWNK